MPVPLALGVLLIAVGAPALAFGVYALAHGGRGWRGGLGPLSERGVHLVAGVRMTLIGFASFAIGAYVLWKHVG